MNAASQWRQTIAGRIAPSYASNSHVAAVLQAGSAARGHADAYSDIDLLVFWHQPPTETERRAAVEQTRADLLRLYPYQPTEEVWPDDYMIGRTALDQPNSGILVSVAHFTTDFMHRTLQAVLRQYDPSEHKQNLIAGVIDGLPLYNPDLIHQWRTDASVYPDNLALAVVNRHAAIEHFWRWSMWLHRGENLMMLIQLFTQVEQKLLHVLLGLNRVYYFGFKWLDVVIARLQLAPPDLRQRLKAVYQVEPATGAQQLAILVEETYDLVEQYLPQVNVERLRALFRNRRPVWEQPPPVIVGDILHNTHGA